MKKLSKYIDYTQVAKIGDKVICVNDDTSDWARVDKTKTIWLIKNNCEYTISGVYSDITIYYELEEDEDIPKTHWKASRFKVKRLLDIKRFDL